MQTTLIETLQHWSGHPLGLLIALALGAVSAAASTCCTLPAMSLLVGYSGSAENGESKSVFKAALLFATGSVLALMIVGGIAGFIGQAAQMSLGQYWKVFAALTAILFGLATLKILPISPTFSGPDKRMASLQKMSPALFGLILGGIIAVCSLPCNPGIFIIMGAAVLQGEVIRAAFLLAAFAVGFSLPLSALVLGLSFGKSLSKTKTVDNAIRYLSGGILLIAGFYLLVSL